MCLFKSVLRLEVWLQSKHRQMNPPTPSDSFFILDLIRAETVKHEEPSSTAAHFYDSFADVSSKRECLGRLCYSTDNRHSGALCAWTPHASLCHTCCGMTCKDSQCNTKPFYPFHPSPHRVCHQNSLKIEQQFMLCSSEH